MAGLKTTIGSAFTRIFKDRQILIRSEQGVEHIHLRRRTQLIFSGICFGVVFWALATTTALTLAEVKINGQARQIVDMEVGYAELIIDLANRPNALAAAEAQVDDQLGVLP